jgi:transcriptional regulator with XRE-family HTH domain
MDETARERKISVGRRLRLMRKAAGMNQTDLWKALDHSNNSTVSAWENGRNEINYHDMARICELTGGTADYLIRNKPDAMPYGLMKKIEALLVSDPSDTE